MQTNRQAQAHQMLAIVKRRDAVSGAMFRFGISTSLFLLYFILFDLFIYFLISKQEKGKIKGEGSIKTAQSCGLSLKVSEAWVKSRESSFSFVSFCSWLTSDWISAGPLSLWCSCTLRLFLVECSQETVCMWKQSCGLVIAISNYYHHETLGVFFTLLVLSACRKKNEREPSLRLSVFNELREEAERERFCWRFFSLLVSPIMLFLIFFFYLLRENKTEKHTHRKKK